tara:strand:+ start:50607 stop:51920 length:1314 start_codon:yes stop_codon:yes gene_type:complete
MHGSIKFLESSTPSIALAASVLVLALDLGASPARAESPQTWDQFRGHNSSGYVADGTLPASWTQDSYTWRRNLGGRDVGSMAIIDGKVFYLASRADENKIAVESVELATGKQRWSKLYSQLPHHLHKRNTFASGTPAVDATHVFVAWSDPKSTLLKCFDHDGNEIWSRDFGSWQSQHGFGTSPRIVGSMVLLFNSQQAEQLKPGQSAGESRFIAVDRKTGETVWETPLSTTRSCYGVPAVYEPESGATQFVDANTGNGMFGLDAKTGKMLWNLEVFDKRCCSTPQIIGDLAIASCGSGGGGNVLVAVRIPTKAGEKPREVYRIDKSAPYVPTPVLKGDRMYLISDSGIASCVNAVTGDTIWTQRIGGNFGASPILVGDTLLLISLDGKATLVHAGDKFKQIGEVDLGGPVGATPAFADGRLLLRIGNELVCLGGKAI